jgi:hypothetical protein
MVCVPGVPTTISTTSAKSIRSTSCARSHTLTREHTQAQTGSHTQTNAQRNMHMHSRSHTGDVADEYALHTCRSIDSNRIPGLTLSLFCAGPPDATACTLDSSQWHNGGVTAHTLIHMPSMHCSRRMPMPATFSPCAFGSAFRASLLPSHRMRPVSMVHARRDTQASHRLLGLTFAGTVATLARLSLLRR